MDDNRISKDLQVVICEVGSQLYGIPISKVSEILTKKEITPVPGTSSKIKGFINLRGIIISVFDLSICLDFPENSSSEKYIIVVQVEHEKVGLIVDKVKEVEMFHASELEEPSSYVSGKKKDYIWCIARKNSQLVTLIDPDKVIAA